jgi:hypothetical protein
LLLVALALSSRSFSTEDILAYALKVLRGFTPKLRTLQEKVTFNFSSSFNLRAQHCRMLMLYSLLRSWFTRRFSTDDDFKITKVDPSPRHGFVLVPSCIKILLLDQTLLAETNEHKRTWQYVVRVRKIDIQSLA